MKQSSSLYILATALVAFVLAATNGMANGTIDVHEETEITVGLFDAMNFNIDVTNDGLSPMTMYVLRTENTLPDANWFSTVCMAELCYAPEVSKTDPVTIQPGMTYKVKFTVYTGDIPSTGTFQLKVMESGGSGDSEVGTIDFSVTASTENSVRVVTSSGLSVVPMPAISHVMIGGISEPSVERVEVLDATGRSIEAPYFSGPDGVRLDVSTLSPGAYFFRIHEGETVRTGRFIVAR